MPGAWSTTGLKGAAKVIAKARLSVTLVTLRPSTGVRLFAPAVALGAAGARLSKRRGLG
jgi:hypothetical protein